MTTRDAVTEYERLRSLIRDIPDYPKPGIVFKDITPLLADAAALTQTTEALAAPFRDLGVTHVVAIESRGFILGAPVAEHLHAGFIPVRKPGKLPSVTRRKSMSSNTGPTPSRSTPTPRTARRAC